MSNEVATRPHYAGIGMTVFGGGSSLPAITSLEEVVSIAQLMARSGVAVPKHLRDNPGACLAVTIQAMDWGANPFSVANKSYSVNDRLAYEAQMLAAVILKLVPMKGMPKYEYTGEGAKRVCKVTITTPEGEAVEWSSPEFANITPKNSPLWKSDPDQQQGYYSIRGWSRRHRPDVILGVYDREEMAAEPVDITPKGAGIADRLSAPTEASNGFNADKIEAETPETPRSRARKPKDVQTDLAAGKTVEVPDSYDDADVLEGDDIPEHLRRLAGGAGSVAIVDSETGEVVFGRPQPSAPIVEEPSDMQDSATDASGDSQEESHGSEDTEASTSDGQENPASSDEDEVTPGAPEAGEVYHLVGDNWDEEDRRDTYKDGKPFSTAGKAKGLAIYYDHAPELEAVPEAPTASEEPTKSKPDLPPEFAAYIDRVEAADTWAEFREAMKVFYATDTFKALGDDAQNRVRAQTWGLVLEMGGAGGDRVDPAADISAYRLMIEYLTDENAIEGTFAVLRKSESYLKAPVNAQSSLQLATKRRLTKLRGE